MRTPTLLLLIAFAIDAMNASAASPAPLPAVRVHAAGHYLETADGRPFFWLGDTAWALIHATTRAECSHYLKTRARQGFTVVQAVVLAEGNGVLGRSALGELPFVDADPARPNDAYFARVAEIVDEAAELGLYVALLPTWGDKLTAPWGDGPRLFRTDNLPVARAYARYLGARLCGRTNIVWMLGGDRPAWVDGANAAAWPHNQSLATGFAAGHDWRPIWREMAAGLAEGAGTTPVCLYHPQGGDWTTSQMLPDEPWLSIHGMQSGHGGGHDQPVWEWVERDSGLRPAKPTLDLEPNYEDHPVSPWPRWDPANGYFRDHDVRKQCYRSVFAGACGVTYGHHAVWGFVGDRNPVINHADRDWVDALERPGARHMLFLRQLMESRPQLGRVPDQSLIVGDAGSGGTHARATRDAAATYTFVYFPLNDLAFTLDLAAFRGKTLRAWWYDPRTGFARPIDTTPAADRRTFRSPLQGPDWVLVLDDAAAGYGPPGTAVLGR